MSRAFRATNVILALLCLMYFISYVDRVNVSTAAAGFSQEFGLSKAQIGLVFSAFAYPYFLFQIIGGWLSDRFGTRRTLIMCGLVWSVATVLSGMTVGLLSMIAARVLLGLGEGATFPAATSAMARWVAPARRGFAQGITHAAARVGNAVAPLIVFAAMMQFGWRSAFFVCASISFTWLILWAISFREDPAQHPRITAEELAELEPQPRRVEALPWMPLLRRMAPITIVYFCYAWSLWLFISWIPQYFLHSYSLDLGQSVLYAAAVFLAGVLGNFTGGLATDWIYRKTGDLQKARSRLVACCMGLSFLSLVPLAFTHELALSAFCLAAGFFFCEMNIAPMWSIPMDIAQRYSGTASGIMNTGSAFAAIVCPVVSGYIIDLTGNWDLPFLGSMALMLTGVALSFFMRPDVKLVIPR